MPHGYCLICGRSDELRDVLAKLANIEALLTRVVTGEIKEMATLDDLTSRVAANSDVTKSALLLIQNFATLLKAAGTDPVKLQALIDTMTTDDDTLAAAVVANTPAAVPPVVPLAAK